MTAVQEPPLPHANSYGNSNISGYATVIQGNIHHHHHAQEQQDGVYKTLLQSLTFSRMDARLRNVVAALPSTCEWLLRHKNFAAWIDDNELHEHHGFLWIKGKPGSGKSTIMRETFMWIETKRPGTTVVSYFFNARSADSLEKSSIGLYRSLVYQVLSGYPPSRSLFERRFTSKVSSDGDVEDWTEMELRNFLVELLTTHCLPALILFVDALDEGDDSDIERMVDFFKDLGSRALMEGIMLRICLSSRHYPHINIEHGLSITLEDQPDHTCAIQEYVQRKLHGRQSRQMNDLRQQVLQKSMGVFLWVVLVVPMLNRLYTKGRGVAAMMEELKKLPSSLHELFTDILNRDRDDIGECTALLQWVLFSMQPLSSTELYAAIQQTCALSNTGEVESIDDDALSRYLLNCSRGLIETTKTKPYTIQFIHETVRESLIRMDMPAPRLQALCNSHLTLTAFHADICHLLMAQTCLHYLLELSKNTPLTKKILRSWPLAKYAASYWWQHLKRNSALASEKLIDLAVSMVMTDDNHLLTWVQLYDIGPRESPLRVRNFSTDELASSLYYMVYANIPEVVSKLLLLGADVNAQMPGGFALQVATRYGYAKVVQVLLDGGADVDSNNQYGTALLMASSRGDEKVVKLLLENGADINAPNGSGTALQMALEAGHEKMVRLLLERGADANASSSTGGVLQIASEKGREKVVQLLLKHGANIDAPSDIGTALQAASRRGNKEMVQILLENGADANAQGVGPPALVLALYSGYEEIVQMLLDEGADLDQGEYFGNTALQQASLRGYKWIVQELLDRGAAVDDRGSRDLGTALQMASHEGHKETVQTLLENGADVNAPKGMHGTALYTASNKGYEIIVQLLLDRGANVNSPGGPRDMSTALEAAVHEGHDGIVQMLLDRGADVNAPPGYFKFTPLQQALRNGHAKIIQLLLDQGADVNAWSHLGGALQIASRCGNKELVKLLLKHGARWGKVQPSVNN